MTRHLIRIDASVEIAPDRKSSITRRIFVDGQYVGEMGKVIPVPTQVTYGVGRVTAISGTKKYPRYRVEWPTVTQDALWLDREDLEVSNG